MKKKWLGQKRKYERENQFQARIVRQLVTKVRRLDQRVPIAEGHWINFVSGTVTPTTAGAVYYLSGVAEGDGDSTRTGNTIFIKSMSFRATLTGVSANIPPQVRCVFFADRHSDGVIPSIADLMYNGNINSHHNLNYANRFWILRDFYITAPEHATWAIASSQIYSNFYRKLGFPISYINTTAAQASSGPNSIYVLIFANHADTRISFEWQAPFVDA